MKDQSTYSKLQSGFSTPRSASEIQTLGGALNDIEKQVSILREKAATLADCLTPVLAPRLTEAGELLKETAPQHSPMTEQAEGILRSLNYLLNYLDTIIGCVNL